MSSEWRWSNCDDDATDDCIATENRTPHSAAIVGQPQQPTKLSISAPHPPAPHSHSSSVRVLHLFKSISIVIIIAYVRRDSNGVLPSQSAATYPLAAKHNITNIRHTHCTMDTLRLSLLVHCCTTRLCEDCWKETRHGVTKIGGSISLSLSYYVRAEYSLKILHFLPEGFVNINTDTNNPAKTIDHLWSFRTVSIKCATEIQRKMCCRFCR